MFRPLLHMSLYVLLLLFANSTMVAALEPSEIEPLKEGSLRKLIVHDAARQTSTAEFEDQNGNWFSLDDFSGRVLVLNFWATWCPPCRKEMPSLDRLQAEFAKDDVSVIAVAVGHHSRASVDEFLEEAGVKNLGVYFDPNVELASSMGALGLPVTVILDRTGMEIARLIGDAEWDSSSAISILKLISASNH